MFVRREVVAWSSLLMPARARYGHVELVKRKCGSVYYVKYRLADGQQVFKPGLDGKGPPARGLLHEEDG